MIINGKVLVLGDNIDTDMILPGPYLSLSSDFELAEHCLEGLSMEWPKKIKTGRVLAAGLHFGCGSSREHAAIALKAAGIECILAESFGAIFYRNAINLGLVVLELPNAAKLFAEGQIASVNLDNGTVENIDTGAKYSVRTLAPMVLDILQSGGLMAYMQKRAGQADMS